MTDISQQLNNATLKKNCILFIDNIYEIDLLECTEVAKAFINCKKSNQVIIAVDSNDDDFHICPSKFGENEIKLLAISYNTEIEKRRNSKKISILSNEILYLNHNVHIQGIHLIILIFFFDLLFLFLYYN